MEETKTFNYGDIDKFCLSQCHFQDACTPTKKKRENCTPFDCPIVEFVNWLMKGKPT